MVVFFTSSVAKNEFARTNDNSLISNKFILGIIEICIYKLELLQKDIKNTLF